MRGTVVGIKENVYFQAAEAIGSAKWRAFVRHVLPNIMPVVVIIFSINIGGVMIAEASLSFLVLVYLRPFRAGRSAQPGRT